MLRIFEYLFTDFQYIILCFYCILSLLFRTLGVRWLRDSKLICLAQSLPQIKISPDLTFLTKSSLGKLWIVPFIRHVSTMRQNFCSSMTLSSLSTARQWTIFLTSDEMATPHFVSWRPSAYIPLLLSFAINLLYSISIVGISLSERRSKSERKRRS